MVEVDVASIVRSGEAPVKEAPRSWSPNPPYFNADGTNSTSSKPSALLLIIASSQESRFSCSPFLHPQPFFFPS